MIILAIITSCAAIGMLCWLLFTLAVFALPAFIGVAVGSWAYSAGAGIVGAIIIGVLAAIAALATGQLLLTVVRPIWLKLVVTAAFVAPATVAGFHATHGIVKHMLPSDSWQITFSVVGALAVGFTSFVRILGIAPPAASSGRELSETDVAA